jgi:hypothetical protein
MAMLVVWLVAAALAARALARRPDAARVGAWLSLVSFAVLTASILWGVLGTTRHGVPPVHAAATSEAAP